MTSKQATNFREISVFKTENSLGFKLSNSSCNTYRGCKRKFWHEKILKTEKDTDYVDDTKALTIGKIYHRVLELCKHDINELSEFMLNVASEEEKCSDRNIMALCWTMVYKYLDLHKRSGLNVVKCEEAVTDSNVVGFVDVVMEDLAGNWWICDLKTAARLNNSLLQRLHNDPQLNLYSYFAKDIAENLNLDINKFSGIRYRVTTKSLAKLQSNESIEDYADRVIDKIQAYDIGVPLKYLNPGLAYAQVMQIYKEIEAYRMLGDVDKVPQNFGFCEQYFKPCPFWSKCYGRNFTDSKQGLTLFSSDNMPDINHAIESMDDFLLPF